MGIALFMSDFDPRDIGGVVAWWDPGSDDSLAQSAGNVVSLTDRVRGLALTPHSGGSVSVNSADANLGNARTLGFAAGASDYLEHTGTPSYFPISSGNEVWVAMVARLTGGSPAASAPCVISFGWGVGFVYATPGPPPSNSVPQAVQGGSYKAYGSASVLNQSLVQVWRANSTNHALWQSGTSVTLAGNSTYTGASTSDDVLIGARPGGELISGSVGDIIVGASLSTSDREILEGYLAWKYGLQATLPGGHTYRNAPP